MGLLSSLIVVVIIVVIEHFIGLGSSCHPSSCFASSSSFSSFIASLPFTVDFEDLGIPFVSVGCSCFVTSLTFIAACFINSCFVSFAFKAYFEDIGLDCTLNLKIAYSNEADSSFLKGLAVISSKLALRRDRHLLRPSRYSLQDWA